jgi:hypothetical protein
MRDEMLKRLDKLVETYGDRKMFVGVPFVGVAAAWAALRDELAAERCENCQHYIALCGWRPSCGLNEIWGNAPDFSCLHFTKKDAPP